MIRPWKARSGYVILSFLFLVECVENAPAWFAQRLRNAMQGAGTDDQSLVRIITSRAEIDLGRIKAEYERLFDKTLESDLKVCGMGYCLTVGRGLYVYYYLCIFSIIYIIKQL